MGLFRARPIVTAEAALYSPSAVAAAIHPAVGRWPAHEAADRAVMGVGMVAAIVHEVSDSRRAGLCECLGELAAGISRAPMGDLPVSLVHLGPLGVPRYLGLVPWSGDGHGRVAAEIVVSRGAGFVPRITHTPPFAGPSVEIATLAVVSSLGAVADIDGRLMLALGIEGVLAWYREAHAMTPAHDALRFALVHAADRMAEAGRTFPPGLE